MTNMITTTEAAQYAMVSTATIRNWIRKGYLGEQAKKQFVTRGAGCGFTINEDVLVNYLMERRALA